MTMTARSRACDPCLRRVWLLNRMSSHLELERARLFDALDCFDNEMMCTYGGGRREEIYRNWLEFDADAARTVCTEAGVEPVCRCDPEFPENLHGQRHPPTVLHVRGRIDLLVHSSDLPPVAIVGSRRASQYAREVATALARDLAACGIPIVSGLAPGVDTAAHLGAVDQAGSTIAVLPAGSERAYPASQRQLHRRIAAEGVVISEMPPGTAIRRWMFPARNRVIAGIAAMTVIVEAGEHSGSLTTVEVAHRLRRTVGAVPGQVSSPLAAGPNALLANGGAVVVRDAQDVVDWLKEIYELPDGIEVEDGRPEPDPEQRALLLAIASGADTLGTLQDAGFSLQDVLTGTAALELSGHVRHGPGGRFVVVL